MKKRRVLWLDHTNADVWNIMRINYDDIKVILDALKRIIVRTTKIGCVCLLELWKMTVYMDTGTLPSKLERVRYFLWRGLVAEFSREEKYDGLDK